MTRLFDNDPVVTRRDIEEVLNEFFGDNVIDEMDRDLLEDVEDR